MAFRSLFSKHISTGVKLVCLSTSAWQHCSLHGWRGTLSSVHATHVPICVSAHLQLNLKGNKCKRSAALLASLKMDSV